MKECPYCKAQIEDNARFCLYCMKPLTEKEIIPPQKKDMRWLFAVAALAMAVVVILLLPDRKPVKPQKPSAATPVSTVAITTQTEMPTTGPTADSMQESTGESAAEPTDNATSTESTVISATEMPAGSTGAIATKPKPETKPATKTTAGTMVPTTTPVAPGTKGTVGTGVAATTKPVNSFVSVPTTKPVNVPTTKPAGNTDTKPSTAATTESTTAPATKATDAPTTVLTSAPTTAPATKATTAPTVIPSTASTTAATTTPTTATTAPTYPPVVSPTAPLDVSALPTYTWTNATTGITYRYRQAAQADVLGVPYVVKENDVVLTAVIDPNFAQTQTIPTTVGGGKQVVALAHNTFKSFRDASRGISYIYLPKSLVAIQGKAFSGSGIQELYFAGEYLVLGSGFGHNSGIGTTWTSVYCSKTCEYQCGKTYSELFKRYYRGWYEWPEADG